MKKGKKELGTGEGLYFRGREKKKEPLRKHKSTSKEIEWVSAIK